jgi:hypothetical protein
MKSQLKTRSAQSEFCFQGVEFRVRQIGLLDELGVRHRRPVFPVL